MPHSTASFRRLAQWSASEFHAAMENKMARDDPRTLSQFRSLLEVLFRNSLPSYVIAERINACLRKYPEFCNRVLGFYPDGTIQLRETIPMRMLIPATPPARFTHDIMSSLVPLLPFPVLGRLAKTCKWMNAHIAQEQVDQALRRCRELFDKVEILTEPSSGRRMIRMFTTDEEAVDVGFMHRNRQIVVLRVKNRTYMGLPVPSCTYSRGFADLFDHVERRIAAEAGADKQHDQKPFIWVDYRNSHGFTAGDVLFVRFFVDFNVRLVSNEVRMQFTEFVQ